jgi:predicted nucleic acid-binding protein
MKLVVDTSIVFSFFNKDSFLLQLTLLNELELISPIELEMEIEEQKEKICKYAKITPTIFDELKKDILDVVQLKEVKHTFLEKAEKLITHKDDAPFLALALELNIPIWSNDNHFKEQKEVLVYTVSELKKIIDA